MLTYHHVQETLATTWTIDHNLDLAAAAVEVFVDINGRLQPIFPAKITKTANQLVIQFSTERTGEVHVRGSSGLVIDYNGFVNPIERPIDFSKSPSLLQLG